MSATAGVERLNAYRQRLGPMPVCRACTNDLGYLFQYLLDRVKKGCAECGRCDCDYRIARPRAVSGHDSYAV